MATRSNGWVIAAYLFLVTATFGYLQPFLPLYMQAAGLSRSQIGLVTGVGGGMALLVQPILGRISDFYDVRRPLICGCALLAGAAYFSFPQAYGFPVFLMLTAIGANGVMYLQSAGAVVVGRLVAADKGGASYAQYRVWGSVGYIVVSLASGLLLNFQAPQGNSRQAIDPLFHTGPWLFVAVAILAWFLPDRKSQVTKEELRAKVPLSPNLKRFLLAYFLYSIALYGASPYISLFLKSLGATPLWITVTFAWGVVIEVLVMRRSGSLSDEYGRRPLLALSFVLLPLRLLLYMPATGPLWIAAVQTLHGVNFGIVGAVAVAFAIDLATESTHGRAQARLMATSGLAAAVGPALLGFASDRVGLAGMFGVSACIAAVAASIMVFGVEDSHQSSRSLAAHFPLKWRRWVDWLDAPPKRVR